jgi:alpha-glucosidase
MLMNLGLCGIANTGPDTGGFAGFATGRLFTRWVQMSVFLPFLRAHTVVESPDQEPWSWGEPYLSINRQFIELRYRLLPYLSTPLWQCTQTGQPMVRPLLLAFQDDVATYWLDDQFLCGDAFLVAPVTEEGVTHRFVYLPAGKWYSFWTDELYIGPTRVEVEAFLDMLPVFVRAGAVVAMAPVRQYVGERPPETLTLHIYPGDGQSYLYEDDGHTRAFESGDYTVTRFALSTEGAPPKRLDIHRQATGRYAGACQEFEVVIHGMTRLPHSATVDGESVEQLCMDDEGHAIRLQTTGFEHLSVNWA